MQSSCSTCPAVQPTRCYAWKRDAPPSRFRFLGDWFSRLAAYTLDKNTLYADVLGMSTRSSGADEPKCLPEEPGRFWCGAGENLIAIEGDFEDQYTYGSHVNLFTSIGEKAICSMC